MGLRHDPASVPTLAEIAGSAAPTWDVPAAALTGLGLSGCKIARQDLERLPAPSKVRREQETMRRVYAAHGLALLKDKASLPALRAAAGDDNAEVRRAAVLALGAVAAPADAETVKALVPVMQQDKDRIVRGMAALSIGRIGGDPAVTALRHAQAENEASLRPYVAIGLGLIARRTGDEAISKSLVKELTAGAAQNDMQGALCVAVGLARRPEAAATLRAIVKDAKDPELRSHAAFALGLIGDAAGGPAVLRPLLDVQSPQLQYEAGLALGLLGDGESIAALGDSLDHGATLGTQVAAALALGRIGGPDAAHRLANALRDKSRPAFARRAAALGLGFILDGAGGRAGASIATDLDWCALTPAAIEMVASL